MAPAGGRTATDDPGLVRKEVSPFRAGKHRVSFAGPRPCEARFPAVFPRLTRAGVSPSVSGFRAGLARSGKRDRDRLRKCEAGRVRGCSSHRINPIWGRVGKCFPARVLGRQLAGSQVSARSDLRAGAHFVDQRVMAHGQHRADRKHGRAHHALAIHIGPVGGIEIGNEQVVFLQFDRAVGAGDL